MKKIFLILIITLISGTAFALETPMKKLSKYFKNGTLIKKGEILCQKELNLEKNQKELNLEKNQKEKDKDKKRRIRVTCVLLSMVRD